MRRVIDFTNNRTGIYYSELQRVYWHNGNWDSWRILDKIDHEFCEK